VAQREGGGGRNRSGRQEPRIAQLEALYQESLLALLQGDACDLRFFDAQAEGHVGRSRTIGLRLRLTQRDVQRFGMQRADAGAAAEDGEQFHPQRDVAHGDGGCLVAVLHAVGGYLARERPAQPFEAELAVERVLGPRRRPAQARVRIEEPGGCAEHRCHEEREDGERGGDPPHQKV
jgi:hypothetical protein